MSLTCHLSVSSAWSKYKNVSLLLAFSICLDRTISNILKWKASGLGPIDGELKNIEQEILKVEAFDPSSKDQWTHIWLRALYNRHNAFLRQNSIFWAQQARLQWVMNGDHKSSFFHNVARIRKHKNRISSVQDTLGDSFDTQLGISECFLNFFLQSLALLFSHDC